jgi:8-oxo-dGTP diphosphatase
MRWMKYLYCPLCGSGLSTLEEEGRERLFCPACRWIHYANPLPSAAALVRNNKGEVLLVKRGVEPGLGKWALPSGFIEIEETPEEACLRELNEETGLEGEILRLVGVYSQASQVYKKVLIIGYEVKARGRLLPGSDSLDAKYYPLEDIPEIAFSSHRQIICDGLNKETG